jgi:hypothetical protein
MATGKEKRGKGTISIRDFCRKLLKLQLSNIKKVT